VRERERHGKRMVSFIPSASIFECASVCVCVSLCVKERERGRRERERERKRANEERPVSERERG